MMTAKSKPIPVLFENDRCMAFDKPANLVVIPTPKKESRTLTSVVNTQYATKAWHLHPVHRLDRETSGVILYAKGKRNQKKLMDLFRTRKCKKSYIALVQGRLKRQRGTITASVESFESKRYRNKQRKKAVTKYILLKRHSGFSVVEAEPVTGRSNQIRIHFKQIGHPLLGEQKYAFRRDFKIKFKRVALHAVSLSWADPVSHEKITVQSQLPNDMEALIASNRTKRR